ncbi:Ribokinase-like protein [Trichocladium antarcticum]|uniref:ATP-dependent (S)-NAD(P)H-hydrate dehydratase n=1 Tax=Trichocladium antarcticum TaxID=1450529 RepID=A0AAN6ZC03_9PEZI|nr:Ribokinase-like protein [Trichocladium antarcticum]
MTPDASTPDAPPNMSAATREMLARVRQMVPPMLDRFHKGQLGRVGVIGGSEDYTGAPYFSAMASARLGCDMSHIICTPTAATVIKSYSPNLMVHPLMRTTTTSPTPDDDDATSTATATATAPAIAARVIPLLDRLHVLVIGPGLGRDPLMHATCALVMAAARARGLPLVLDADALQIVQADPGIVRGYAAAVLTPNVVEFGRLARALGVEVEVEVDVDVGGSDRKDGPGGDGPGGLETRRVEALGRALGGCMVVQKGRRDFLSDGRRTLVVDLEGGRKRSGGQGDTLTGSIATFLAWRRAYLEGIWEHGGGLEEGELLALAAFGGSAITRVSVHLVVSCYVLRAGLVADGQQQQECSRLAFAKRGRSLQASDLTEEVHTAFMNLFGEVDDDTSGARL